MIADVVARALAEDLGPLGDLTSALLPPGASATAAIVPRAAGVLAGGAAATEVFAQVDSSLTVRWTAADGDGVLAGEPVARVSGALASILTAERTALNFLCHLSGIATLTRRYVEAARPARIRDTRKTLPGLRALEKAAVRAGGGVNHRGSLSDGVLIKDNHLAGLRGQNAAAGLRGPNAEAGLRGPNAEAGLRGQNAEAGLRGQNAVAALSVEEAVERARAMWPGRTVQVECDTLDQVKAAVEAGADLVLLDNMAPGEVADCVALVGGACLVEVSGGVSLESVAAYAAAGADLIAVGALTHSAPVLDIGLDL